MTSRQGSPIRVRGHQTHVSCIVASGHLLANTVVGVFIETVIRVFIRAAFPCVCYVSVRSNGRRVTVSVAEGCRTVGADVTCSWDEQAGDVVVASGGREPR